jgi:ribonuclease HII
MKELALEYPEYQWHKNAGYGTKKHLEAIAAYGMSKYHRRSFKIAYIPN